jgi:hypothetical protein
MHQGFEQQHGIPLAQKKEKYRHHDYREKAPQIFPVGRIFTFVACLHVLRFCRQLLHSIPVPASKNDSASRTERLPVRGQHLFLTRAECCISPKDVNQRYSQSNKTLPLSPQNSKSNDQVLNPHLSARPFPSTKPASSISRSTLSVFEAMGERFVAGEGAMGAKPPAGAAGDRELAGERALVAGAEDRAVSMTELELSRSALCGLCWG